VRLGYLYCRLTGRCSRRSRATFCEHSIIASAASQLNARTLARAQTSAKERVLKGARGECGAASSVRLRELGARGQDALGYARGWQRGCQRASARRSQRACAGPLRAKVGQLRSRLILRVGRHAPARCARARWQARSTGVSVRRRFLRGARPNTPLQLTNAPTIVFAF
jgi:hypothetical protein